MYRLMITLKTSEFEIGAVSPNQFPKDQLPEVAVAGRSNVGKSSLINFMLNRRKLTYVGNTPGKTREVNFFLINEAFRFVDLPGFGYAKVSQKEKEKWQGYIESYLSNRPNLKGVIHLVDSRHPGQKNDLMMAEYLKGLNQRTCVVATKIDKLKKNQRIKSMREIEQIFGSKPIQFSSLKKIGKPELWNVIETWLEL